MEYTQPWESITKMVLEHFFRNIKGVIIQPSDSFDHKDSQTVFLIPWFSCVPACMKILWDELREYFNVVYSPLLPKFNTSDISTSSKLVEDKLKKILRYVREEDINIIWHSLGGLIWIEAVKIATTIRINNVIAMSTPFGGTKLAELVQNVFPSCKDMSKQGGYHGKTKININWQVISYISKMDSVVPEASQKLPKWISDNQRSIGFQNFDHADFIIWDSVDRVANIIHNSINHGKTP